MNTNNSVADFQGLETEQQFVRLKAATIMMVDDEPIMMDIVQAFLEEEGYSKFVTEDQSVKAFEVLNQHCPDILLLDLKMPQVDGFEILQKVRASREFRHLPIIVLTSSTDAQSKLKALELGATDFLAKPVDQSELVLRLRNTLTVKAYQDQLAYYDDLTKLPNRKLFMDRLGWAISRDSREDKKLAVIDVALDRFKQINESLGLRAGDMLLRSVAQRLQACVRQGDVVSRLGKEQVWQSLSRLGGDEFSILLPKIAHVENAAYVVRRILDSFNKPFDVEGVEVFVTASAGIALYPDDGMQADTLVKHAGEATDFAKLQGRNNYQFYSKEINAKSRERLSLETDLRHAIERNELELYYQPKIDLLSGKMMGMEALLRWHHPRLGLVAPAKFIPLAEEASLILAIGEWVIQQACQQTRAWQEEGITDLKVSVNVSAQQIQPKKLLDTINGALAASGLDPKYLMVELTESMAMDNPELKIALLNQINESGISFSVDDFGTGYSSLSYLQRLPISELKIDRSFIVDLPESKEGVSIVKAIVAMAHSLDLEVVAEGVETAGQVELLKFIDCDVIQGYFFSKPLRKDDFAAYAKNPHEDNPNESMACTSNG